MVKRRRAVLLGRALLAGVGGAALVLAGACSVARLGEDVTEAQKVGLISGRVTGAAQGPGPVIAVLFAEANGVNRIVGLDVLVDAVPAYAIVARAGATYYVFAFQDLDGNGVRDPREPAGTWGPPGRITPLPRQILRFDVAMSRDFIVPVGFVLDTRRVGKLEAPDVPVIAGQVTTLDDPVFSQDRADTGMWTPYKQLREVGSGVYFLEPYEPTKIPILFVHGMGGTPTDFRSLIALLDRTRYQAWVFHYPSGARLARVADVLFRTVRGLHDRLRFDRLYVTAHSMGGLVARAFIIEASSRGESGYIRLFVTFATPWDGHKAAAMGVKYSPAVMPAWLDIEPGSDFLASLRTPLPPSVPHYLFFSFRGSVSPFMASSNDGSVTVASELVSWAQDAATRTLGYDLDHEGILNDPGVHTRYAEVLREASEQRPASTAPAR